MNQAQQTMSLLGLMCLGCLPMRHLLLVVVAHWLEVLLWVITSGALSGRLLSLNDETTVAALPVDLLVTLKELARLDAL